MIDRAKGEPFNTTDKYHQNFKNWLNEQSIAKPEIFEIDNLYIKWLISVAHDDGSANFVRHLNQALAFNTRQAQTAAKGNNRNAFEAFMTDHELLLQRALNCFDHSNEAEKNGLPVRVNSPPIQIPRITLT